MKAKCECSVEPVVVEKDGILGFTNDWGSLTCVLTFLLTVVTGGSWLVVVLIWNSFNIISPQYRCLNCGKVVEKNLITE